MRVKRVLCFAVAAFLAVTMVAGAADDERRQANPLTEKDIPRPDVAVEAEAGLGARVETVLEPGLARIEAEYGARLEALQQAIASTADAEVVDELDRQAQELKLEWSLALVDRHIELARERGDAQAEAEAVAAKQAMTSRPAVKRQQAERDPNAGIHIAGGER